MSGRADIITLAQTLGLASTDAVLLDRYYTEAIQAITDYRVRLEATIIAVTAGEPRYAIQASDASALRIAAAFFGTRELTRTTLVEMEAVDHTWQATEGTPTSYIEEHEDTRGLTIHLWPTPDATSAPAVLAPDPFGLNYPLDRLVVLTSDADDALAPWLDYALACSIVARDLLHPSAHRDPQIAAAAAKLATIVRSLGGAP